ncbi:MAG: hypothetical protein LC722_02995 [Actinobacteria bacterium]|nr:hypothetical protein [Actinomycetota bacterium]
MSEQDNLPARPGRGGHYEAWYLTFSDPSAKTGYWIRYTLHAPAGAAPEGRLWFARFDLAAPERTLGLNRGGPFASEPGAFEVRVGDAVLRSGHLAGALEGGGHSVAWDLDFDPGGPTYRMLPDALYRGSLAPSKPYVPNPDTRFRGRIEIDGETIAVDDVPGQQGHVVGTRHAERWAWAQCDDFAGEPGTVLVALVAQGRRGPLVTPHTTFVGLRRDGDWIRLRKVSRRRDWGLGVWRIALGNKRYRLAGAVRVPADRLIRADYVDPDGSPRYCHNSEVSSCRLTLLERRAGGFEEVAELTSEGTVHAEWGGRTPAPQVLHQHTAIDGYDPA